MANKTKKSNTPRHKRLNQAGRLQAAEIWLANYNGKNIVRGYSKHFAVDLLCAVRELRMIGVAVEESYVEALKQSLQSQSIQKQKRRNQKEFAEEMQGFYFIAGYTEGGAPYGIELDEVEADEDDSLPW